MNDNILYNILIEFIYNQLNKNINDKIEFKKTIYNSYHIIKINNKIYFQKTFNNIMFMIFSKI